MTLGQAKILRRILWRCLVMAVLLVMSGIGPASAQAQENLTYLRVGTGPTGEAHFHIGGLIASALSNPPGSQPCERGGNCGVPDVIGLAISTNGSAANAEALGKGRLDLALVQADVGMWAFQGAPPFTGHAIPSLRSIARLYQDSLHLVSTPQSKILSPRDLRGKRVSLGEKGSGTLIHARQVLAAWGLKESDMKAQFLRSSAAADALQNKQLDAFFVLDAVPVPTIVELAKTTPLTLVPLVGPNADALRKANHLLRPIDIPADSYAGITAAVPTLSVGVDLAVSSTLSNDMVYAICKSLWHPTTVKILTDSQSLGDSLSLDSALAGQGLMLHPGAEKYYAEIGVLN